MKQSRLKNEVGLEVSFEKESLEGKFKRSFKVKFVGAGVVLLFLAAPNFDSLSSWLMRIF